MTGLPRVLALISGRGSNLEALLKADLPVEWALVISNRPEAPGLQVAASHGVPTQVLDHTRYSSREAFDGDLQMVMDEALGERDLPDARGRGLVVLAGFMRILSQPFVEHFAGRMLNIHPSLLPKFKGLHTHRQVLASGDAEHGCSVHWVTPDLDHGPVLAKATVPVLPQDDEHTLGARVLAEEHRLYPAVVRAWAEGRLVTDEAGVQVFRPTLMK